MPDNEALHAEESEMERLKLATGSWDEFISILARRQRARLRKLECYKKALERYEKALNEIACWDEKSSLDEPASARIAREALRHG